MYLFHIFLILLYLTDKSIGLSRYCSSVSRIDYKQELENCQAFKNFKNSDSEQSSSQPLADINVPQTDGFNDNNVYTSDTSKRYNEVIQLLDRVLISLQDSNITRHETKRLFLDIVRMITIVNDDNVIKFCMRGVVCNLFKNCEFPMEIEYSDWSNDAIVAARMAALLTFWSANERVMNSTYLTQISLYSLLRSSVADYANIYDSKLVFKSGHDTKQRYAFEATKNFKDKTIKVRNIIPIFERDAKNFYWLFKWTTDVKTINLTKSEMEWTDEMVDLRQELTDQQIRQLNQIVYPTATFLNKNYRYVSGVTYDCVNAVWNRIVSVPFMYPNGEIRGVAAVSISLNNFDLKQCSANDAPTEDMEEELLKNETSNTEPSSSDPFLNTHRCDPETTMCSHQHGKGFVRGSYLCKCRDGYYYASKKPFTGFDGVMLEDFYSNISTYDTDYYDKRFKCKKCSKGCATCVDSTPCETEVPENVKLAALIINLTCILICIILAILTWYHMTLKVLKTSSPKMLFMVLLGAIISYMEIIPMHFESSTFTCIAAQIFQLLGFLIAYGALVLKTWRECKLFYVKSVKTIKITDNSLFKRLGIIVLIGITYIAAWSGMQNRPHKEYRKDAHNLKYETCSVTFWNFISMGIQLVILLWGVVLSFQVRRASIAFKETKLITWAIFNEGVVLCFVIAITVLLQYTKVSCYIVFFLNFIRIHLAITVMLTLLFSYKIYTIILARKKPFHSTQSSGLLSSFTVSNKDANNDAHASLNMTEETERERELKDEIQKLYRQIEEMRSLSMRIANPHLVPKKNRFLTYPTKKIKKESKLKSLVNAEKSTIQESESFVSKTAKNESDGETKPSHTPIVSFKI